MTTASGTPAQITVQMQGIQGPPGGPGQQGIQGEQGIQGVQGPPGTFAPVVGGQLFMQAAASLTFPLMCYAPYTFTIASLKNLCVTNGEITLTIQVNGTNVTGLTNLLVTTTPQNPTATDSTASVATGDVVTVILTGGIVSKLQFAMIGLTNP